VLFRSEKSPAFSATTLTIPTSQTNYFSYIVDNSRRMYSRDRAEVEEEIKELISPRNTTPTTPKPIEVEAIPALQRPPMVKTEQGSTTPVASQEKQSGTSSMFPVEPTREDSAATKTKRKRTRSRSKKKKPEAGENNNTTPTNSNRPQLPAPTASPAVPTATEKKDPTELRLRH
jgi:hypothetical protein